MKFFNKIIASGLFVIACQSMIFASSAAPSTASSSKASSSKATQVKAQAQALKNRAQSSQARTQSKSAASSRASDSQQEPADVKQLIEELKSAVEEIKCSCGSSKKDKDGKSESGEKRCTHDKEHLKKVEKAFEIYKNLHKSLEKGCIEQEDHQKIKPHVKKLFECKNIQKMPFNPKICRANSKK